MITLVVNDVRNHNFTTILLWICTCSFGHTHEKHNGSIVCECTYIVCSLKPDINQYELYIVAFSLVLMPQTPPIFNLIDKILNGPQTIFAYENEVFCLDGIS